MTQTISYPIYKDNTFRDAKALTVEDQYELAKTLAANCGYQLSEVDEDERVKNIKALIGAVRRSDAIVGIGDENRALLIEGLEGLLR